MPRPAAMPSDGNHGYGVVGALSAFYHDSTDINDPEQRMIASHRLVAKMPTIAAWAYKYSIGQPFPSPSAQRHVLRRELPANDVLGARRLRGQFGLGGGDDEIFILHADHEQNASTSAVRLAGSSGANPFACIAAGISSLWGPSRRQMKRSLKCLARLARSIRSRSI